jgi:hypothetical protein
MGKLGVTAKWIRLLPTLLLHDQDITEKELDAVLDVHLPKLGVTLRKRVKEAFARAAYRTQSIYPVVDLFLCDDAHQFNWLTDSLALCWIHEFRHSKQLIPRFEHHRQALEKWGKTFWLFLLAYREHPDSATALALRAEFDQLFTEPSGYDQLDECKARTLKKRDQLLMVLIHPEILAAL